MLHTSRGTIKNLRYATIHYIPVRVTTSKSNFFFCKPKTRNRPFLFIFLLAEPHGSAKTCQNNKCTNFTYQVKTVLIYIVQENQ